MNREQLNLSLPEPQLPWATKGIFSDHYILDRLSESTLWPNIENAETIWNFCKNLWEKRHVGLARGNEELTKKELLEPVLERLGFPFLPKSRLPISEQQQEPDYLLLPDEETKDEIFDKDRLTQYSAAVTLLEAKKVNHPLSAPSKSRTTKRFPHQQIRGYLDEATDDTGKPFFKWAILTNGNLWRLYCRDARPGAYFEFDFEKALDSLEYFKIFIALFSPAAFVRDSEVKCQLDYLQEKALEVQTKLEDDLRKRVLVILTHLANGFYGWKENHIKESQLDELYENCLIFLYRLLFILYAEGRALLPVKPAGIGSNKLYRVRYSLVRLLRKVQTPEIHFFEHVADLYKEILNLFHLINGDQPSRNKATKVPQYNGGLFDHREYPLLEKWRLEERTLAEVLRGLMYSRIPSSPGETRGFDFGETIDYANLEVRQLGSIYEGLLEHHLVLEDQRLVLRGDKAKRKATGTYYTPDYIVQYIVNNTLQPLCDRVENSKKVQGATRAGVQDNSFAEGVLQLNVLDPAMGSGHFLVRATEFLADQIVYHPTTALHIEEVPRGFSHEEVEIAYWRRRVVESCIYGVDLNPLAVELAKLSLWLTCISADQPLNFLDHHLRPGNSLIGAEIAHLGSISDKRRTKQVSLSFGPDLERATSEAIKALAMIEAVESSALSIIKEKETRWEREVHKRLQPYRDIADVWSASSFGLKIKDPEYQRLAKLLVLNPKARSKEAKKLREMLKPHSVPLENIRAKIPFHWEFEFPEVFFNEDGSQGTNPGFDAIIGNPPYVRIQVIKRWAPDEVDYYKLSYKSAAKGNYDIYVVFVERALQLLSNEGRTGYILPHKFFQLHYGQPLRALIAKGQYLSKIVHFGAEQVFSGSTTYTCLLFLEKDGSKNFDYVEVSDIPAWITADEADTGKINKKQITSKEWNLVVGPDAPLFERLSKMPIKLGAIANIFVGLQTSADSVFIMNLVKEDSDTLLLKSKALNKEWRFEKDLLFPLISGTDVSRYAPLPNRQYILFPYKINNKLVELIELDKISRYYPMTASYLSENKVKLQERERGKFKDEYWYRFGRSQNIGIQGSIKLCVPRLVENLYASIDEDGSHYLDNVDVGGITLKPSYKNQGLIYLLGLINSKLLRWYFPYVSVPFRGGWLSANRQFISLLPIQTTNFSVTSEQIQHDQIVALAEKVLASNKKIPDAVMESEKITLQDEISQIEQEIDQIVYELYGLTKEEIRIVEDSTER